jgi:hypothetical protein
MVGGIVSSAIVVDSWPRREGSPRRRPVVETDQCVLDHAVAVVRRVHSKTFARRERRGQSVVLVLAHELGLHVGVRLLQNVDGSAQGRPRARRIGRLEAVTAFLAWRHADGHAVEKKRPNP